MVTSAFMRASAPGDGVWDGEAFLLAHIVSVMFPAGKNRSWAGESRDFFFLRLQPLCRACSARDARANIGGRWNN